MSAVAVVATLNGIIVHMIMIGRVIYGTMCWPKARPR